MTTYTAKDQSIIDNVPPIRALGFAKSHGLKMKPGLKVKCCEDGKEVERLS